MQQKKRIKPDEIIHGNLIVYLKLLSYHPIKYNLSIKRIQLYKILVFVDAPFPNDLVSEVNMTINEVEVRQDKSYEYQ